MLMFLRKKIKVIMVVVAILFAASMFYGMRGISKSGGSGGRSKELAKINGVAVDPYRYREIMSRLVRQMGTGINAQNLAFVQYMSLEQSLDFMLLLSSAKKNVHISGQEIDMVIDNIVQQEKLSSRRELEQALKRSGLSFGKFKDMLKDEMLVQKMVRKVREEAKVTPDDLREVKVSHILVTSEALARELLARVKKGENFSSLARKYSQDPGSAVKGGDLGYITTGNMLPSFEKAVFSLKIGEISDVVTTNFGYHIIKVTDSRLREFGKEKDIEKAALMDKQDKAFQKWSYDLKSNAKVEIIDPELKGHYLRFRGNLWEAVQEYKRAIAENPVNPYLHISLADSYNAIGKKELAIEEYQTAIKTEGGNPEFYMVLAQVYEKDNKRSLAIEQYRRASMVAGEDKAVHKHLLEVFKKLNAWNEYNQEKAEIAKIEKKEKFEKELKGEK
jgi:foldase protein PrsA